MELSADQVEALDRLAASVRSGSRVSVLRGPAGTGKTTLMRIFAERMQDEGFFVFWAAPTGKAAVRLSEVTGQPASTLHSLLYRRVTEGSKGQPLFGGRRDRLLDGRRGLLVVDEASMCGKRLYDDLCSAAGSSVQLLFVGDHEQLPPVADALGPDLHAPTAELVTIHRQALESPIVRVATDVRMGKRLFQGKISDRYERRPGSVVEAADWMTERLSTGGDAIVLTGTNLIRENVNRLCRKASGRTATVEPGEQLVVLLNNRDMGRMNGETLVVDEVSPVCTDAGEESGLLRVYVSGQVYFVHGPSIGADLLDFKKWRAKLGHLRDPSQWLHVDYGYALTVHKSQASEWKQICFLADSRLKWRARSDGREGQDPNAVRRLLYTAITRAKEHLLVLDV